MGRQRELFILAASVLVFSYSIKSHAFAITGAPQAGESATDSDCSSMKIDTKISQWCPKIIEIMHDQSSCANKALKELSSKPVQNLNQVCSNPTISEKSALQLTLATMEKESGGDPNATGDGGKSQGLLQTTTGDAFEDCKSGDQKEPMTGLRCGLCELFEPVAKSGKLFGGKEGFGKQFGPWQREDAGQIDAAKKLCGGSGGGSTSGTQSASNQ